MKFIQLLVFLFLGTTCPGQSIEFEPAVKLFDYPGSLQAKFFDPFLPVDFDDDGDYDFIGTDPDTWQVLIENTGSYQFNTKQTFAGYKDNILKITDVNADGKMDAVFETFIALNNGSNGFDIEEPIWFGFSLDVIVETEDFDKNGFTDILRQKSSSTKNDLLLLHSNDGTSYVLDTLASTYSSFGDLDIGDINNDGLTDIVALLEGEDDQALILLNKGGSYDEILIPGLLNGGSNNLFLMDLDNDADLDILIGEDDHIYFLENTGDPSNFTVLQEIDVPDLLFFQTADLNKDGYPDLVTLQKTVDWNFTISIFENLGNFTFSDPALLQEISGSSSYSLNNNGNYINQSINIVDYNGDGKDDILYGDGFSSPSSEHILYNKTTTSSTYTPGTGDIKLFPNPSSGSIHIRSVTDHQGDNFLITDIFGRTVQSGQIDEELITLTSLASGTFFFQVPEKQILVKFTIL